jgi:FixJ family two-component response regulator
MEPRTDHELFDLVDAWVEAQAPRSRAEAIRQCSHLTLTQLVERERQLREARAEHAS